MLLLQLFAACAVIFLGVLGTPVPHLFDITSSPRPIELIELTTSEPQVVPSFDEATSNKAVEQGSVDPEGVHLPTSHTQAIFIGQPENSPAVVPIQPADIFERHNEARPLRNLDATTSPSNINQTTTVSSGGEEDVKKVSLNEKDHRKDIYGKTDAEQLAELSVIDILLRKRRGCTDALNDGSKTKCDVKQPSKRAAQDTIELIESDYYEELVSGETSSEEDPSPLSRVEYISIQEGRGNEGAEISESHTSSSSSSPKENENLSVKSNSGETEQQEAKHDARLDSSGGSATKVNEQSTSGSKEVPISPSTVTITQANAPQTNYKSNSNPIVSDRKEESSSNEPNHGSNTKSEDLEVPSSTATVTLHSFTNATPTHATPTLKTPEVHVQKRSTDKEEENPKVEHPHTYNGPQVFTSVIPSSKSPEDHIQKKSNQKEEEKSEAEHSHGNNGPHFFANVTRPSNIPESHVQKQSTEEEEEEKLEDETPHTNNRLNFFANVTPPSASSHHSQIKKRSNDDTEDSIQKSTEVHSDSVQKTIPHFFANVTRHSTHVNDDTSTDSDHNTPKISPTLVDPLPETTHHVPHFFANVTRHHGSVPFDYIEKRSTSQNNSEILPSEPGNKVSTMPVSVNDSTVHHHMSSQGVTNEEAIPNVSVTTYSEVSGGKISSSASSHQDHADLHTEERSNSHHYEGSAGTIPSNSTVIHANLSITSSEPPKETTTNPPAITSSTEIVKSHVITMIEVADTELNSTEPSTTVSSTTPSGVTATDSGVFAGFQSIADLIGL